MYYYACPQVSMIYTARLAFLCNILHAIGITPIFMVDDKKMEVDEVKNPFLVALGERVRALRARRGLTRKALAGAAQVSERHLASLEHGEGNASILVLHQVATALQCSLAELLGDVTTVSPEWLLLREMLSQRTEEELRKVRVQVSEIFGSTNSDARTNRIALIGLRGAGKTTLGQLLAKDLGYPFIELSREIEKFAGCSISEIHNLYGTNAYRRYERRALEEATNLPRSHHRNPRRVGLRFGHFERVVIALLYGLVASKTRGSFVTRCRSRRYETHGWQLASYRRSQADIGWTLSFLRKSRYEL